MHDHVHLRKKPAGWLSSVFWNMSSVLGQEMYLGKDFFFFWRQQREEKDGATIHHEHGLGTSCATTLDWQHRTKTLQSLNNIHFVFLPRAAGEDYPRVPSTIHSEWQWALCECQRYFACVWVFHVFTWVRTACARMREEFLHVLNPEYLNQWNEF